MASVCLPAGDIFVPVTINENDIFQGALKVLASIRPLWDKQDINFKVFTDGITNKLIACSLKNDLESKKDVVLVRIYGNKTDLLIDRKAELRNIKALHKEGLAPQVYGVFENGLVYEYYPGVTLNVDTVIDPNIWPLVARRLANMHKVNLADQVSREPMAWDKTEQFLALLPEPFSDPSKQDRFVGHFGSVTRLRIEYERLKLRLTKIDSPIVFAHNDLLLGNVIYNEEAGAISFIDYEYAAYNYQAFDIANHFNEFVGLSNINYEKYPSKTFQLPWLRMYLEQYLDSPDVSEEAVEKLFAEVEQFALASHFLWGIWSLIQFEHSHIDFDFGEYAAIRLGRYYKLKDKVYKELS